MKGILGFFFLLIGISCSHEVFYQVHHEPIALPDHLTNLVVAAPADPVKHLNLSKKEKRKVAFDQATQVYMLEKITEVFSNDDLYSSVKDTTFSGETENFLAGFDEATLVLIPFLSLSKTDGFTISSDDENRNYSTYYANLTCPLYISSRLTRRILLNDKTKVEGSEFVLIIDAFSEERLRFSIEIENMLANLAAQVHQRWYPRTETITKIAYTGSKFKGFDEYFNNGEYDKAEELVIPYLKSNNLTVQMKASYNLYLLYSAKGDSQNANKWLEDYESRKEDLSNQYQ